MTTSVLLVVVNVFLDLISESQFCVPQTYHVRVESDFFVLSNTSAG